MISINKQGPYHIINIDQDHFNVSLLNYGASIYQIQSPDINGHMEDLLLEYNHIDDYHKNNIYLNATIGPITGRINKGLIHMNNHDYQFSKNQNNKHTLHSGNHALSYQFFDYEIIENTNQDLVKFSKTVNLFDDIHYRIDVIYTIKDQSIKINYLINTNKDFIFNLTNHAYFNLSGNLKNSIHHHQVQLNTNIRHQLDQDQVPTGQILKEDLYDFTKSKSLSGPLEQLCNHPYKGFDDIYFYPNHQADQWMGKLYDPISHRHLSVYASYDHLLFYTHNNIGDKPLKHIDNHIKHYGICFECQKSPIGFDHPQATNPILKANQIYDEFILFQFSVKE